jgi:hypothetical protein
MTISNENSFECVPMKQKKHARVKGEGHDTMKPG